MKTTLVIVESPTKVKAIKKFLTSKYKVEATMGHVRDLPKSQLGIDTDNNYEPRYITIRGKGKVLEKLRKEAKNCDKIFLATDPDREGEAISWHLSKILKIDEAEKCRIEFNEITKTAVRNAVKNPRSVDMDLVNAQQTRRILDRLVGYKISPLLWKNVRKGLSAGRVQSVAVRLICDREEEIRKFVPKEYWSLIANLLEKEDKKQIDAKFYGDAKGKIEINTQDEMDSLLDNLKEKEYKVKEIKKGERRKNPPLPFTTSSMQQEAYKKLGFSIKKTMMIAQQLYEGIDIKGEGTIGLITYIRTDSTRISEEAKKELKDFIVNNHGANYYNQRRGKAKANKNVQDAHECIRPTSALREANLVLPYLSKDQSRLYKLIWDRTVASQMQPAIYNTISVDIAAGDYIFKASGSSLKFPGFISIYGQGKDEKEDDDGIILPELYEGQILDLKKLDPKQHFTEPPARYTEATLVKILEEKGIGRPSTYAPTITTILNRGYIIKEKKYLSPTELGETVTKILIEHFSDIVNAEFTAKMEKKLDEIAEGDKDWIGVIDDFYNPFKKTLSIAEETMKKIKLPEEVTDEICELCGSNMVVKHGRYGKFLACPSFPECRNTKPILETLGIDCPKCGGQLIVRKTKRGRKFFGCSNYPKCDFVSWDEPVKEKCPLCNYNLSKKVKSKETLYKCTNEKCDYEKKL